MKLDKKTPVGTVAIQTKAYPFKTVMIVSAEEFAEFGLEDTETYEAKVLTKNNSGDSHLCFSWSYLGEKIPAWD
jgi:hypothetical protein